MLLTEINFGADLATTMFLGRLSLKKFVGENMPRKCCLPQICWWANLARNKLSINMTVQKFCVAVIIG